ncbi:TatD DNase family protein [Halopseudomonas salegens]|uniref:TatD DNase family protein n=2 Tax=Halopseudomonas salegens TaxID=1434072 RepID=A0A1H2GYN4_9GAMM|nr:TatD DNase family protein [Halopseudomonas salegens]
MRYIDTHTHFDFPDFAADRAQVLSNCTQAGIERLVVVGVTATHWPRLWGLVTSDQRLSAAFGLHPMFLAEHQPDDVRQLNAWLTRHVAHPQCCAVGEIGLDYFLPELDPAQQRDLFEQQLALAAEFQLPALLHVRRAHADTIAALKRFRLPRGGIVHAFAGSLEEAREYRKLGFKLGLGGAVTWPQAKRLRRVVAELPADSLVLETDAPDMAPAFAANQRNSPEHLPRIAAVIAELRAEPLHQLADQCWHNSCELFNWPSMTVP